MTAIRSRWAAGLVTTTLALSGFTQLGLAAPASAAEGPCSYDGVGSVALDGGPAVGTPVTATVVGAAAGRTSYTWSGTGFGGAVHGPTLTARPDVVGAPVHLAVQVRGAGGRTFAASCDFDRVAWGHLAKPAAPKVTGSPVLGGTLHAAPGAGDVLPDGAAYHYEWFAGDSPSAFATGPDLELRRALVGATLTVKTFVTAPGRLDSAWSTATVTEQVVESTLAQPGAPSIAGVAAMASTLTASPAAADDVPDDATYEYRWFADGEQFATGPQVTLAAGQVGHTITVGDRVSATGYATSPWSAPSAATSTVAPGVLAAPTSVTITGTPSVGSTLSAVVAGSWTEGTQLTFTWKADGVAFSNAPGAVTLTNAEAGRSISVEVAGSLAGYTPTSIVSPAVGPVAGVPLPDVAAPSKVTITGTPKVGRPLRATVTGSWTPGAVVTYVWKADGRAFGTSSPTVVLSARELGRRITVTLTGSLSGYRPASVVSAATGKVAAGTLTAATPKIHGKARVGKVLTVKPGRWTPGTRLTYRWFANGRPIAGATSARLRLAKKLGHQRITVRVTGRLTGYTSVTRTSRPTGRIT